MNKSKLQSELNDLFTCRKTNFQDNMIYYVCQYHNFAHECVNVGLLLYLPKLNQGAFIYAGKEKQGQLLTIATNKEYRQIRKNCMALKTFVTKQVTDQHRLELFTKYCYLKDFNFLEPNEAQITKQSFNSVVQKLINCYL